MKINLLVCSTNDSASTLYYDTVGSNKQEALERFWKYALIIF